MAESMLESIWYRTPIGGLKIVANGEGICSAKWLNGRRYVMEEKTRRKFYTDCQDDSNAQQHLRACKKWLDAYFDGSLLTADPAIPKPPLVFPEKSQFFRSVWDTLLSSGVGEILTYKEVAQRSGKPTAARAAASAVKIPSQSLSVLMPCHRVLKSRGKWGVTKGKGDVLYEVGWYTFNDGTDRQLWLLKHEQDMVSESK